MAMEASAETATHYYKAVFISDIHLGTRNSQALPLLDFLRSVQCETLFLVGDIVDLWKVRRGPYWPQSHNDVLQKILRKARKGTRVVFVPGNHDEGLRDFCGMNFGGIELRRDCMYEAVNGKTYLIIHGDEFDVIVRYARWLAFLGDRSYEFALAINGPFNFMRRCFGFGYWSLSNFLKQKVKGAVNFIGEFEDALVAEARRRGADGLISGHIHHANDRDIGGIHYLNSGDWVESCTAIGEREDGIFEILHWHDVMAARARQELRNPSLAVRAA